jgi:hypothetical protein
MKNVFLAPALLLNLGFTLSVQAASVDVSVPAVQGVIMLEKLSLQKAQITLTCVLENGFSSKTIEEPVVASIEQDRMMAGPTNAYQVKISDIDGTASLFSASSGSCEYVLYAEATDRSGMTYKTSSLGIGIGTTGLKKLNALQSHISSGKFAEAITKDLNPLVIKVGHGGDLSLK